MTIVTDWASHPARMMLYALQSDGKLHKRRLLDTDHSHPLYWDDELWQWQINPSWAPTDEERREKMALIKEFLASPEAETAVKTMTGNSAIH